MRKKTISAAGIRHRSSQTGRFVSKTYAAKHRSIITQEKIRSAKHKRR